MIQYIIPIRDNRDNFLIFEKILRISIDIPVTRLFYSFLSISAADYHGYVCPCLTFNVVPAKQNRKIIITTCQIDLHSILLRGEQVDPLAHLFALKDNLSHRVGNRVASSGSVVRR